MFIYFCLWYISCLLIFDNIFYLNRFSLKNISTSVSTCKMCIWFSKTAKHCQLAFNGISIKKAKRTICARL